MPLRYLIVDDDVLLLDQLCAFLESDLLGVVGCARTAAQALRHAEELRADVAPAHRRRR